MSRVRRTRVSRAPGRQAPPIRTSDLTQSSALGRATFNVQLSFIMATGTVLVAALGVLGPLVVESLDISRTQFGWLISVMTGVNALVSAWTGRVSDRIGGRRLAVITCLWAAAMVLLTGLAPVYGLMILATAAAGLSMSAANPSSNQLIADHLPPGRRGLTMGVKQSGVQLGLLLTGVALPTVALALGWRGALFVVAAAAGAVGLLLAVFLPPAVERPAATGRRLPAVPLPPEIHWLSVYAVAMGAGTATLTAFLPLYARESIGLTPTVAGATIGLIGFVGVVGRILVARAVERHGRFEVPLMLLGFGAALATGVLLLAGLWTPLLWIGVALAGTTAMSWNSVMNLAAVTLSEGRPAGRASGRVNAGFMTGYTLGPVVFGATVDVVGYRAAWFAPMAAFLVATTIVFVQRTRSARAG